MRTKDKYRFRNPKTGRETIIEADPGVEYYDRETGDLLQPVAWLTPAAPTGSSLPWAVENLRFCDHCDQPAQRDLDVCPTCGGKLEPLTQ